jgi:hypothetical protein
MDKNYLIENGETFMTAEQAAEYLGKKLDTIHYHLYKSPKQVIKPYPKVFDGAVRSMIKQSELDTLRQKTQLGRPRGMMVAMRDENRVVVEVRENRFTDLSYRLINDPDTEPHWWCHCQEHGVMVGFDTKREAIYALATPWEWCDECNELYEQVPDDQKKPPSQAQRQT